jgi:hypothetical protein
MSTMPQARDSVEAIGAATRTFEPRRLAFTWRVHSPAPGLHGAQILAAAERHLLASHARVELEVEGRALRFGSGSGARRSWLGATRGGRLGVRELDGGVVVVTVHAVVARTLLICALPAILLGTFVAWPLGLPFALVGAANLWPVDAGARRLITAALER